MRNPICYQINRANSPLFLSDELDGALWLFAFSVFSKESRWAVTAVRFYRQVSTSDCDRPSRLDKIFSTVHLTHVMQS